MATPRNIIIEIPNPCHESWDQMTPDATGRFCNNCQKSVIDFTLWSDAQLYQFFSKETREICGRFDGSQVNRTISIPPQPHSRLYRIAVALGLTLLFTHGGEGKTFAREPTVFSSLTEQHLPQNDSTQNDTTGISGVVLDGKGEPIVNASISIRQDGILKSGAISDYDGKFLAKDMAPGTYEVTVSYVGYTSQVRTGVIVTQKAIMALTIKMQEDKFGRTVLGGGIIRYKKPLVDKYQPSKTTVGEDQIKHYPH